MVRNERCYKKGGGSWSDDAYSHISTTHSKKTASAIFTHDMHPDMSPVGLKFRESRDSDEHPESLAIYVALDETGSMGKLPEIIVKEKLGKLMSTLLAHGVAHPQILFGAIGDQRSDRAPLQVGQFESETAKIDSCLTKMFLEGNGGGTNSESYQLAWLIGARHTSIDCFEKRGIKGFIFTIGDECVWEELRSEDLKKIMGYSQAETITTEQLLAEAKRMYHVFHIHINEASNRDSSTVFGQWRKLLGQNFIVLDDHNAIGETIASTVAVVNGVDLKSITKTFDKKTALSVSNALVHVTSAVSKSPTGGVVKI